MRALLDVNVLIALLDEAHIHHAIALDWLEQEQKLGWATCPITQNGCIRIMSHPSYPGAFSTFEVAERLTEATQHSTHEFWPARLNLLQTGVVDWQKILGHRQVTDAYLLALAVQHKGRFVTFDQRIDVAAAARATAKHLVVLR